jgi:hypothetical protein
MKPFWLHNLALAVHELANSRKIFLGKTKTEVSFTETKRHYINECSFLREK